MRLRSGSMGPGCGARHFVYPQTLATPEKPCNKMFAHAYHILSVICVACLFCCSQMGRQAVHELVYRGTCQRRHFREF
jgi:hypothetical protein